jgi:hypothetical protein
MTGTFRHDNLPTPWARNDVAKARSVAAAAETEASNFVNQYCG